MACPMCACHIRGSTRAVFGRSRYASQTEKHILPRSRLQSRLYCQQVFRYSVRDTVVGRGGVSCGRVLGLLVGSFFSVFIFSIPGAWGQQVSSGPAVADSGHVPSQNNSLGASGNALADCSSLVDASRIARGAVERDRQQMQASAASGEPSTSTSAGPFPSDLRQDLMVLQQREAALSRCAAASRAPGDAFVLSAGCSGETNSRFSNEPQWRSGAGNSHLADAGDFCFFL